MPAIFSAGVTVLAIGGAPLSVVPAFGPVRDRVETVELPVL